MVFSSILFLAFFLPVVLLVYFLLPGKTTKNLVLLAASLFFYAWGERNQLLVLLASILGNYAFGLLLGKALASQRLLLAKGALALGITFNLGLLVFFKYAGFLLAVAGVGFPHRTLPLGISFFTFQGVSYLVDLWRGSVKAERNLLNFALFKSFFPQLIAGPIVRYRDIASQLTSHQASIARFSEGVGRFVLGLAKKTLVANPVATYVDAVFGMDPSALTTSVAWLGALGYTIQIYFDFSGYSDMAIGLGQLFGFRLPENFDRPYASASVTEFWRRWHMSLSTWFRDYVYIPLGGNRAGRVRTHLNLAFVFLLCGFWHGANWTFLLWGAYHGFFLVLERAGWGKALEKLPRSLSVATTLFIVLVGWVLFRSPSVAFAAAYFKTMFAGAAAISMPVEFTRARTNFEAVALAAGLLLALLKDKPLRLVGVATFLVLSVAQLSGGTYNPFIYFRF